MPGRPSRPDPPPADASERVSGVSAASPRAEIRPRDPVAPVNRAEARASNKEARRTEAEEDRGLIEAARRGDRQAFRTLVERHQRRAFTIAVTLVRDENDAREVVQEAFLRVYKGLDNFQGGSSFFTWLYRIVTNLAIDLVRKPGRQGNTELDEERDLDSAEESDFPLLSRIDRSDPLDAVHRGQLAQRIGAALDALPSYHRGVILMREVEGMSYDEMAEAMNVSKGTIMSRLFHARQKMQRALGDLYVENGGVPSGRRGRGDPGGGTP